MLLALALRRLRRSARRGVATAGVVTVVALPLLIIGPLRHSPPLWNAAHVNESLTGSVIRNGTQLQQIVSFVGQAQQPQKLLVRADLLVSPQALENDVAPARVPAERRRLPRAGHERRRDELHRDVPAAERREPHDRRELGRRTSGNRRRRPDPAECLGGSSSSPRRVLAAGCGRVAATSPAQAPPTAGRTTAIRSDRMQRTAAEAVMLGGSA